MKTLLLGIACLVGLSQAQAQANLTSFQGAQSGQQVTLQWEVSIETNMDYYTVFRSSDNLNYTEVGSISAFGTTNTPKNYSITDTATLADTCYHYSLRATEVNSDYQYLDTIQVCFNTPTALPEESLEAVLEAYPNPLTGAVLHVGSRRSTIAQLKLSDATGQVVYAMKSTGSGHTIDCTDLPAGVYFLQVVDARGQQVVKRIIKM